MNKEGTTPIAAQAGEDSGFRNEYAQLPLGVARLGGDGRLLQASPRLGRICGRRPEALPGLHLAELLHPLERAAVRAQIQRIASGASPGCTQQRRLPDRDGARSWARLTLGPRLDAQGRPAGLIALLDELAADPPAPQALRESEERLRLALDAAEMDAFDYDPATDRVHRHGPLGCAFGMASCATGQEWLERIHPADRAAFCSVLTGLSPEQPVATLEYRVRGPEGDWRRMFDRALGHFDAAGRLQRVVGVSRDVTERRRTEEALAQERELLRQIVDNIPVMLCMYDPRSGRYKLNRHFATVLGWRTADANQGDFLARVHPDPRQRAEASAFMRSPGAEWREWNVAHRDGTPVPCEWTRIRLSDGTLIGLGLDRRQRKANEARLARHSERQALLLEVALVLLKERSDKGGLVRRVFGLIGAPLGADAAIGFCLDAAENGEPALVASCGLALKRLAEARRRAPGPTYCASVAATGRARIASAQDIAREPEGALARELGLRAWMCHPLFGPDGRVIGTFTLASSRREAFTQDEADFVQAVCYFMSLAWEQLRAAKELREVAAERAQAARRKDEFLATLAHELRNPLNPIRNAAQVLRLGRGDETRLRWGCDLIERQVRHLARLIDDLLDVSRLTLDKLELRRQRIGLREVIEGALETLLPQLEARQHALSIEQPEQELLLDGDPVRLVQVLQNLFDNAVKYTPPGGHIALLARACGDSVELTVRDSGIGLAPEACARVFELFYQGERAAAAEIRSGLGIGLTLVQRLVQMHGGSVEARSAGPGRGSEFVVRLPLPDPQPEPSAGPAPEAGDAARPRRILVVDDNLDSAESTALLLRMDGHEVHLAHDGLQALREAERLRPTLVLMDIGMPVLDGYEAVRRIRATEWGRDMLVVAQTGWGQAEDIRRAREAGFDAHLTKPVDPEALAPLLARQAGAAAS